MAAIWKFPLDVVDLQAVKMPAGSRLLTVQVQHGSPVLWAIVQPTAPVVRRDIRIVGTGHPLPAALGEYIGTFQMLEGELVWHAFDARTW